MVQFVPLAEKVGFTVSQKVGPGCPNLEDDVQFVQFGYLAMSVHPETKPHMKPIAAAVTVGARYSGAANDPLTICIREHQKIRGGTQDGHISVVKGGNEFYDGTHGYQVSALTNLIHDLMPGDYPRIDKHPKCPPILKAAVQKLMKR